MSSIAPPTTTNQRRKNSHLFNPLDDPNASKEFHDSPVFLSSNSPTRRVISTELYKSLDLFSASNGEVVAIPEKIDFGIIKEKCSYLCKILIVVKSPLVRQMITWKKKLFATAKITLPENSGIFMHQITPTDVNRYSIELGICKELPEIEPPSNFESATPAMSILTKKKIPYLEVSETIMITLNLVDAHDADNITITQTSVQVTAKVLESSVYEKHIKENYLASVMNGETMGRRSKKLLVAAPVLSKGSQFLINFPPDAVVDGEKEDGDDDARMDFGGNDGDDELVLQTPSQTPAPGTAMSNWDDDEVDNVDDFTARAYPQAKAEFTLSEDNKKFFTFCQSRHNLKLIGYGFEDELLQSATFDTLYTRNLLLRLVK